MMLYTTNKTGEKNWLVLSSRVVFHPRDDSCSLASKPGWWEDPSGQVLGSINPSDIATKRLSISWLESCFCLESGMECSAWTRMVDSDCKTGEPPPVGCGSKPWSPAKCLVSSGNSPFNSMIFPALNLSSGGFPRNRHVWWPKGAKLPYLWPIFQPESCSRSLWAWCSSMGKQMMSNHFFAPTVWQKPTYTILLISHLYSNLSD